MIIFFRLLLVFGSCPLRLWAHFRNELADYVREEDEGVDDEDIHHLLTVPVFEGRPITDDWASVQDEVHLKPETVVSSWLVSHFGVTFDRLQVSNKCGREDCRCHQDQEVVHGFLQVSKGLWLVSKDVLELVEYAFAEDPTKRVKHHAETHVGFWYILRCEPEE